MLNRRIIGVTAVVTAVLLGAYLYTQQAGSDTLKETQNIKQLVQDYSRGSLKAQAASITPRQLIVTTNDKSKVAYDLPKEEFFVSIAPYLNNTHPCATHSLTSCQGELTNQSFHVYIEDAKGKVVVDQTMKSEANGFIDLWLPRDKTYSITVKHNGKTVKSELSTFETDNTCISTLQLM
ncbi:CueP family metal-binding protein [Paenibacillus turpanensis]|uniref:CueP family metal-binding protein n=1 Tax=Paenibacillus turpanensis TaxID=2689078 RepID=UPI00140D4562|nr:CueP family metal-binding protein [Paenibacillus turpanensis]